MNAAEFLKDTKLPVALIAGEYDTLIRPARTQALRSQVPNLVFDKTIAGAGHNDIYLRPEFQQAMRDALAALH
jgi:pimeloyl-ACP methyl ester carboxylesterase